MCRGVGEREIEREREREREISNLCISTIINHLYRNQSISVNNKHTNDQFFYHWFLAFTVETVFYFSF